MSRHPISKLRILFAGQLFVGGNSRCRALALEELAARVYPFDFSQYLPEFRWTQVADHHGFPVKRRRDLNRAFAAAVCDMDPDVVWVEKGVRLSPSTLADVRKNTRAQLVHYNPDDPFGEFGSGRWRFHWRDHINGIPLYDTHFVARRENIDEYRSRGARRVFTFDRSFDPNVHRPLPLTPEEALHFRSGVGFIGSWAPARARAIEYLIDGGIPVAVWGPGWDRDPHWGKLKPHFRGGSLVGDSYARAICGMDIALHFLRRENRDQQDSRTFEIPACGTFMLAERSPDHERLFKEGDEIVLFDSQQDLLRIVRSYLDRPDERSRIARNAYQRCIRSGYDHASRLRSHFSLVLDPMGNPNCDASEE